MAIATSESSSGEQDMTVSSQLLSPSSSSHETLSLFATLLGTYRLKEEEEDENEGSSSVRAPPRKEGLLELLVDIENLAVNDHNHDNGGDTGDHDGDGCSSSASFSCLSLGRGDHERHSRTREEAEEQAALLLARPLCVGALSNRSSNSGDELEVADRIADVPSILLHNLYESFSTLVDARLRAYASFLAHHGQSLATCQALSIEERNEAVAGIERKLEVLMMLGSNISVDAVVTSFQVSTPSDSCCDDNDEDQDATGEDDVATNEALQSVNLPIALEGVFDLTIPHRHFGVRNTSVTICASGTISADFVSGSTSRLQSVHVAIDTQELLAAMMEEASHIVSVVVDMTNDACSSMPRQPKREFLATIPRQICIKTADDDEYLNRTKNNTSCIVTPDLSGHCTTPSHIPSLSLDDDEEQVSASLSLECCATIIDFAICDIDDKILCQPAKRPRLTLAE